jgi:hypothetical protein
VNGSVEWVVAGGADVPSRPRAAGPFRAEGGVNVPGWDVECLEVLAGDGPAVGGGGGVGPGAIGPVGAGGGAGFGGTNGPYSASAAEGEWILCGVAA